MKPNFKVALVRIAVVAFGFATAVASAQDPLPSWNDGSAEQAILEFVKATTTQAGPQCVLVEARIATFDQDGTR